MFVLRREPRVYALLVCMYMCMSMNVSGNMNIELHTEHARHAGVRLVHDVSS